MVLFQRSEVRKQRTENREQTTEVSLLKTCVPRVKRKAGESSKLMIQLVFSIFFLLSVFCLLTSGVSGAEATATVTLAWNKNLESDLAGYKIHYGTSSKSYQYNVKVGNFISCNISGLEEGKTYYFAATAYDTKNNESGFSQEIAYTVPILIIDTDGDRISDSEEINTFGTDPEKIDTDGDGINDGEEINYWSADWNSDNDGDGIINLLDPDSDGDGFSDGREIDEGFEPSDPNSKPEYVKIWIETEDGSLHAPMEEAWDHDSASGGYIWVPSGVGNLNIVSEEAGYAEYSFEVPVAGTYAVWGRVIANNDGENSFFVSIDGGNYLEWHTQLGGNETWIWDQVRDGWVKDGNIVYLDLDAGIHNLTIRQREDGTKIDKILITNDFDYVPQSFGEIAQPQQVKIWLEAEDANLYSPMEASWDHDSASGGYIWVPSGVGNLTIVSEEAGYAEYSFEVPVAGTYAVWGRVIANNDGENSFFVSIDGGNDIEWHTQIGATETWFWDQVRDGTVENSNILYLDLAAGSHTLTIKQREDGTKLDKILITNDFDYVPESLGEIAQPQQVKIWLEAEDVNLYSPMEASWDHDSASGGYIWVPSGVGNLIIVSEEAGYAEYSFEVPVAGIYAVGMQIKYF